MCHRPNEQANNILPNTLKTVANKIVSETNAQFQSWSSWIVATPKNMKMIVSDEPDNIFIAYFSVV